MAYVMQHLSNADVAILEGRYQRALNEFKKAEELHPQERSKDGIQRAERLLKEKHERKMKEKMEEDVEFMVQQWREEEAEEKKANEKYLNMTADDRKLGTGFYHI